MQESRSVRSPLFGGATIKPVFEDVFDRPVGARADVDGVLSRRLNTRVAVKARKTDNAQAGAEALSGMGPLFDDLFAQGRCCGTYPSGVASDFVDGPAPVLPVVRWP